MVVNKPIYNPRFIKNKAYLLLVDGVKEDVYFVEEDIQMWFVKNVLHFMRL